MLEFMVYTGLLA